MIPTNCYKLQTDQKMTKRPLTQQNTPPKKKKRINASSTQHCYSYDKLDTDYQIMYR